MPLRTRSCATCRRKRIKCDAQLPQCLMCIRAKQICPGPLAGPLIVDMTANARHGMQRRRKKALKSRTNEMQLVRFDTHIFHRAAVIEAFYTHFLTYFTSSGEGKDIQNQLTWLQRLPQLSTDGSNKALMLALEATATAYGALMGSNTTSTRHTLELYGAALHAHEALLRRSGAKQDITIHMVSTSVLFSFFEAMQATTADAYRNHISGAAKMLEVTGPGQCTYGVLCQLFYHVRTQMLFVQLASGKQDTPVSVKKILYDTLLYKDTPLIHRLMCCIAVLGGLCNQMREEKEQDLGTIEALRLQVDQLWDEYSKRANTGPRPYPWYDHGAPSVWFSDAHTAITFAYFSSAYLLLSTIVPFSAPPVISGKTGICQIILDAATFLDIRHNAFAYMRIATSLLLVVMHSRNEENRRRCMDIFTFWSKGSMRGISALALDAVRRIEERSNSKTRALHPKAVNN